MKSYSNQRAKLFNTFVLGGITLFAGGLLMVNIVVDPWGLMSAAKVNVSDGVPVFKSANERVAHAYLMRQNNFNVLHVGSSRVRYLLDQGLDGIISSEKSMEIYPEKTVYSAGVSGVNIRIMRRLTEHALALQNISDVLFMIDFVAMNDARPDGAGWDDERYEGGRIVESRVAILSNYLSLNMLEASIDNLKSKFTNTEHNTLNKRRSKLQMERDWKSSIEEFRRYDLYGCYSLSQSTVNQLDLALSELKARNVDAKIMIPLIHYTLFEMIWQTENWSNYKKFIRSVVNTAAKYGYPVWHFSPYGPYANVDIFKYDYMTDETFNAEPNFYDPGHTNHIIGHELLKLVRGLPTKQNNRPSSFSVQLTPDNVELEIKNLSDQREVFNSQHPDFLYLVPKTKNKRKCS